MAISRLARFNTRRPANPYDAPTAGHAKARSWNFIQRIETKRGWLDTKIVESGRHSQHDRSYHRCHTTCFRFNDQPPLPFASRNFESNKGCFSHVSPVFLAQVDGGSGVVCGAPPCTSDLDQRPGNVCNGLLRPFAVCISGYAATFHPSIPQQ
eukprot:881808-Rhodomonas_salina.6